MSALVAGASTRKVADPFNALACETSVSGPAVSRICEHDREVASVRQRPLGHVAFPSASLGAASEKAPVDHQVVSPASANATVVTTEGAVRSSASASAVDIAADGLPDVRWSLVWEEPPRWDAWLVRNLPMVASVLLSLAVTLALDARSAGSVVRRRWSGPLWD